MTTTFASLRDEFARVGLDLSDVSLDPAPRIDVDSFNDDARVVLVVTTYAKDAAGKRYMDKETKGAATEVRRFPVRLEFDS